MTLRHIRIFLAVCENGNNTTRAARALYLAQPAVSRAVAELEEYYGVRLFDRIGRRLYLTEAGRRMWEYAVHICGLFNDLEKGLRGWDEQGVLRVGASITIGSQFLPGYVDAFRAAHPGVDVRVWVGPSEQLEEKLLHNTLDVALMEGPVHGSALTAEEYMADTLAVVCAPGRPFTQGQTVRWTPSASSAFCCAKKAAAPASNSTARPRPRVSRSRRYGNPPARWRW